MGKLCSKEIQSEKPLLSESDISDSLSNSKINEKDFTPVKLIGKGSYGNVFLVRFNKNNKLYAMKVLSKSHIRVQNQEKNTISERNLMVQINCPFIVNIKFAFQNDSKLFLVQEFLQGGDLFFHIHTNPRFSNDRAKFYVIELVLALEFLHKNNMLYRDLKPENILIGADGHIKLTDFGLSKILSNVDKAFTICGTVQYLAPEILTGEGYNLSVDWWSLGCIMFEMLVGKFPFRFQKDGKLNIEVYKKPVRYPAFIDDNAKDFMSKLLEVDPTKRLGNKENGWEEVKSHPYFKDVDWDKASQRKLTPPFLPKVDNEEDIRYFEKTFTDEPIYNNNGEALYHDEEEFEENYKGFTYVAGSCNELKNIPSSEEDDNN